VSLTAIFAIVLLFVPSSRVNAQGTAVGLSEADRLDLRFLAEASAILEGITWSFPPRQEIVVSYRRFGQLDLRVHFPVMSPGECAVKVWLVPEGEAAVYDQLLDIREKRPEISASDAIGMIKVTQVARRLPCDDKLALVLGQGIDLPLRFIDPTARPAGVWFDTARGSVDLGQGDMHVRLEYPQSLDHPVARWASDVRRAVEVYIARTPVP
jgi:hypothetical protein